MSKKIILSGLLVASIAGAQTTDAYNPYALKLGQRALANDGGNVLVSPQALGLVLLQLEAGTRGGTQKEIQNLLGGAGAFLKTPFSAGVTPPVDFDLAVHTWLQKDYTLSKTFAKAAKEIPSAQFDQMDLIGETESSTKALNTWAIEQTHKRVPQIIEETSMEEMLSAAVACVRPVWNAVGAPAVKGAFKSAPGKSAPANFVSLKGSFAHWSNDEGSGVEVPLTGADLSVLFLLPKDEKGLTKFEKSWTLEKLRADITAATKNYVILEMPKVTLNYGRDVIPLLRTLGIKQAFAKGADYSPMTGTKEFHLSTLRHRTCLVLDDKSSGAPVAAAEAPATLRLDRPFAVIVRQPSTGAVLMVGRLAKP